ncbi:hypothetical protein MLD38_012085 [Melastoma candidum]|uniref:Uncharacterized protein n=1 Tax=Melastoma candidum TaxID=119954 RepID=A0ACB9R568_9MYRT|nr:hypothetical protein MLD38_012085 [Melastoma candidum]
MMVDLNSDMRCFSCNCLSSHETRERMLSSRGNASMPFQENKKKRFGIRSKSCAKGLGSDKISAESFTFRELACATSNFRPDNLLGEGGFSRVYKGTLHRTGEQVVAIKQMDKNGISGNKEFLQEVTTLSRLRHENLMDFVGYCFDGDQRLLVFRYLCGGTLADRMFGIRPDQEPLDWITRMKIAYAAAKVIDTTRPNDEQNLVNWANPRFKDPKQFPEMVDPLLEGKFPEKDLNQAVAIAAMCLQYEASARPLVSDVVTALSFLSGVSVESSPETSGYSRPQSSEESWFDSESPGDNDGPDSERETTGQ